MNNNKILFSISLLVVLLGSIIVPGSQAQTTQPPELLTYQGHLLDHASEPVLDGTYPMAFSLWDALTGGTLLWGPEAHDVGTSDGFFTVLLGTTIPVDAADLATDAYLEITVGGETLSPRQQLAAVAFALSSSEAARADVASDAGLLDGQDGAYYRNWANLTAVPAGFADGVDDDTIYTDTNALSAVAAAGYVTSTGVIEVISNTGSITVSVSRAGDADLLNGQSGDYYRAWDNLTGVPAGFADGVDDDTTYTPGNQLNLVGATFHVDETGLNADLLDGQDSAHYLDWINLTGVPAGFADGVDDDTVYTDADALSVVQTAGYVTETGVIRVLSNTTTITANVTYADVAGEIAWVNVTGAPVGLEDGDDDTTYTAGNQLNLVGTTFNVAETGLNADSLDGQDSTYYRDWGNLTGVPSGLSDGDDDTTYTAGNQLGLSGTTFNVVETGLNADTLDGQDSTYYRDWGNLTGVPVGLNDGDDDTTYAAGAGLGLAGTTFSADTTYLQRRVSSSCAVDSSIQAINADGTVMCQTGATPDRAGVPSGTDIGALATTGNVGMYSSITIGSDGLPIISYSDYSNDVLKVAHCSDIACSTATIQTVDSAADVGIYTSIAIGSDGLPVISYYDYTNYTLKFAHCSDSTCSAATIRTLDSAGDSAGRYTSIAIGSDGWPIISYSRFVNPNRQLCVAHCTDLTCAAFAIQTVDTSTRVGMYSSIAIGSDGLAVMSYLDDANGHLKVAHCDDLACSTATAYTVDPAAWTGQYTSIAIGSDGLPLIAHHDDGNDHLKVAHCDDPACSTATLITVDDSDRVGAHASIGIGADGMPIISHYDYHDMAGFDTHNLKVTRCTNVNCTAATSYIVDGPTSDAGQYTSITIGVDGFPIIAYYDTTDGNLKVAHCTNEFCVPYFRRR